MSLSSKYFSVSFKAKFAMKLVRGLPLHGHSEPSVIFGKPCIWLFRRQYLAQHSVALHVSAFNKSASCVHFKCSNYPSQYIPLRHFFTSPLLGNNTPRIQPNIRTDHDNKKTDNIYTVPNFLTLSRAVLSPVAGYMVLTGSYPAALGVFVYAGVTDYLDGWIARKWPSQRSVIGSVIDPIADKLLVVIYAGSLVYVNLIPGFLALLIVLKDAGLMLAGIVIRWQTLPKPKSILDIFSSKAPSIEVRPLTISKWNTALQITTLAVSLAAPVFGFVGHPILPALWYTTALTTVSTAISYIVAKDVYVVKEK